MVEEVKKPDPNAGVKIEGEGEGIPQNVQEQESRAEAIKVRAREGGWVSRKEWTDAGKSLADWVPAKEFVGRESLFGRIREQKNEIFNMRKEHSQQLAEIKKYIADMSTVEYNRALRELQTKRKEALQAGDIEKVETLQQEIDVTKEASKIIKQETKPVQQQQQIDPVVQQWIKDNPWFNTDPVLHEEAEQIGLGMAMKNPEMSRTNPGEILRQVTEKVKKLYPEKFNIVQRKTVSKVEDGGSEKRGKGGQTVGGKRLELSWDDLTSDQKAIGKTVIGSRILDDKAKKNGVSPRDQYLMDMQERLQTA